MAWFDIHEELRHMLAGVWLAQHPKILLAIVLGGGLLLRLYGIDFGLPYLYNIDEPILVDRAVKILATGDLNPHWFDWPGTTIIYMLTAIFVVIFLAGLGLGIFAGPNDFRDLFFQDPTVFYLSGRILLAVFGVASIWVTYCIARRLFNRSTAFIAAIFLALSPLHVYHSQLIRPDVLMTFLILVVFWFCLDILQRKPWSGYLLAGLFTGLAIATKYPAAIVALLIVMAHLLSGPWRWIALAKLLVSSVVSLGGAFIGSPFLFLDFGTTLSHFIFQNRPRHVSGTGEGLLQNLAWYIQIPLLDALSIGGLVLAGMGMVLSLTSRRKEQWLLLAFPIFFVFSMALLNLRWARWVLPVLPFLCILGAAACDWTATQIGDRWHDRMARWIGSILLLVVAFPLVKADVQQGREMVGTDTRTLAREWMLENVPAGSRMLLEHYTPQLPRDSYRFLQVRDGRPVEVEANKIRTAVFRSRGVIGKLTDTEAIYREQIDYMVLSNWHDRYLAERESYDEIVSAYEALMNMGSKIYEVHATPGKNRGPSIYIYRFDREDLRPFRQDGAGKIDR